MSLKSLIISKVEVWLSEAADHASVMPFLAHQILVFTPRVKQTLQAVYSHSGEAKWDLLTDIDIVVILNLLKFLSGDRLFLQSMSQFGACRVFSIWRKSSNNTYNSNCADLRQSSAILPMWSTSNIKELSPVTWKYFLYYSNFNWAVALKSSEMLS